jgi:serine phosphatase RsbU (regulator of sigma subunit)/Tfp pilus assembly protein PilF
LGGVKKVKIIIVLFLLASLKFYSQNVDSLKKLLGTELNDTAKLKLMSALTEVCEVSEIPGYADPAIKISEAKLAKKNLTKAETFFYKTQLSNAYMNKGFYFFELTKDSMALLYYQEAFQIKKELGDLSAVATLMNNMGVIYKNHGDIERALNCYLKCLEAYEKMGNKTNTALSLINIAIVYQNQKQYKKAREFHERSLALLEETGNKAGVVKALNHLATTCLSLMDTTSSRKSLFRALELAKELHNKKMLALTYGNLGGHYAHIDSDEEALRYYIMTAQLDEELKDLHQMTADLVNLGGIYLKLKKPKEGRPYAERALKLAKETGVARDIVSASGTLANIYKTLHLPAPALEMWELHIRMRDSITNENTRKSSIESQFQYTYDKKEAVLKEQQEKERLLAEEKSHRQKIVIVSVIIGILLLTVFSIFIFNRLRITRRQKMLIEKQKYEIEIQKHIVEEKHKEITDSINYAERIQRSFIATKEMLDENLKNYFVLFKPKDVVSGDFYWAAKLNNGNFALVTADSTGHGVPGAIMSLLNITSLERAIEDHDQPAEILNATRKTIIERLKKDGSKEGGKDGMDASLTVYDLKNKKLIVAAANNPVWIVRTVSPFEELVPNSIREGVRRTGDEFVTEAIEIKTREVIEIKAEKMPVGKHDKDSVSFTQHEVELQKGDVVYTLTDGFPDQFGGEKGKKYMSKNLRELLSANAHLPMNEQKKLLEKVFADWVGKLEQVDDVTLIGVRI